VRALRAALRERNAPKGKLFSSNLLVVVGWVEVTKPFGYAATERSRSAGTAQQPRIFWLGLYYNSDRVLFSLFPSVVKSSCFRLNM